ncbi:serine hydrolase domain-containing protein [Rhodohalobacter mucosus]|uniref:Beta-lactamase-related domain-containing protein n=1 Tax=Rhodohalobacter mucosus TaxID=2079485 RepID=A0A316TTL2_9BACT|nr:serine hydrolase domain-containing protein [Rhodohalobacter mucosus]PWN06971.1 hypothetical protein DDZ15_06775 [Rhodohalobacter mucosus]
MNRQYSFIIVLSLLSWIMVSCQGFEQHIERSPSNNDFTDRVDSLVISTMNRYNIPGLAIGLVSGDSIRYAKGYGIKTIQDTLPVTEFSNFHTASISKLITAQAIMMLVEENRISLDDRLPARVPNLRYSDKRVEEITIRQLLNHTSGLPDVSSYEWGNNHQSDRSLEQYVLSLNLKPEMDPSSQYHYSNLAYNILGYVIERVTGTSFELYVKEHILDPNGMSGSDFRYYLIPDSLRTSPHSKNWLTGNVYVRKTYPYTREHGASSTLNSSASDLSKWMISFMESMIANNGENVFTQMTQPDFRAYPYIGLGFQLGTLESRATIGHYGGDKGYRSYLLMIPEEETGLVLLANCDYNEDFRQEILHPLAGLMLKNN